MTYASRQNEPSHFIVSAIANGALVRFYNECPQIKNAITRYDGDIRKLGDTISIGDSAMVVGQAVAVSFKLNPAATFDRIIFSQHVDKVTEHLLKFFDKEFGVCDAKGIPFAIQCIEAQTYEGIEVDGTQARMLFAYQFLRRPHREKIYKPIVRLRGKRR